MTSVDTTVLLRWLLGDVPAQTERVDLLIASGARLRIDDVALVEVVFVLEKVLLLSRASIGTAIDTVLSTAAFEVDRNHWHSVSVDYLAHPKLSIADIHLAHRAAEHHATPLYSFDHKLASQITSAELL